MVIKFHSLNLALFSICIAFSSRVFRFLLEPCYFLIDIFWSSSAKSQHLAKEEQEIRETKKFLASYMSSQSLPCVLRPKTPSIVFYPLQDIQVASKWPLFFWGGGGGGFGVNV
jgi:hypothetical protein